MSNLVPSFDDRDGNSSSSISAQGIAVMVKSLEDLNPGAFLVEDNLNLSIENVHSDLMEEIIAVCPEPLEKATSNSKQETALNKFIQFEKLLLHESLNAGIMMRVNSMKKMAQTAALDLCNANSQNIMTFQEISLILDKARDQSPQLPGTWKCLDLTRWPMETRNVLLVVLVMIAAAAFTVTCNLPPAFLKEIYPAGEILYAKDVITGRLPKVFYLMIFNSAGFFSTMAAIVMLIWSLNFRTILLFVVICTCIVYIMLVNMITPKFSVRVGSSSISSIALVWSLALAFISSGIAVLSTGKYSFFWFCHFIDWLWTKGVECCGSNRNP